MPKTTTIDHTSVLEMALLGYELQRNRIEAAIAEIRSELSQGGPSRSISTATASTEPKTTGKKRFSAAARKRMALAQRKRWQLLKAKKAEAAKPKRKTAPKKKATAAPTAKKPPVRVKAAKKVARKVVKAAPKPKAKKTALAVRKAVAKPKAQESVPPVQAAVAPAPTEATA
jgi:hypothetical protein